MNHQGQPIALMIAETLEQAVHAGQLVQVTYRRETGTVDIPASNWFCRRANRLNGRHSEAIPRGRSRAPKYKVGPRPTVIPRQWT